MDEARPHSGLGMVILAAGGSSRMARPKQLLEIGGVSMLANVLNNATQTVFRPIVVVLGATAPAIRKEASAYDVSVAINDDWSEGLSTSLKKGLAELIQIAPECRGALIVLADQPLISYAKLNEFASVFDEAGTSIVASRHGDVVGVPALFPRSLFEEFAELKGDVGAKAIIGRRDVVTIDLPEAAFDVDTPDDFRGLMDRGEW